MVMPWAAQQVRATHRCGGRWLCALHARIQVRVHSRRSHLTSPTAEPYQPGLDIMLEDAARGGAAGAAGLTLDLAAACVAILPDLNHAQVSTRACSMRCARAAVCTCMCAVFYHQVPMLSSHVLMTQASFLRRTLERREWTAAVSFIRTSLRRIGHSG